jgi:hypothetical protein
LSWLSAAPARRKSPWETAPFADRPKSAISIELACLIVVECFSDLFARGHNEGAMRHHRLVDRFGVTEQEHSIGGRLDSDDIAVVMQRDQPPWSDLWARHGHRAANNVQQNAAALRRRKLDARTG